jgi:hypothetical protein
MIERGVAGSWSIVFTTNPSGPPNAHLHGVSCVSATDCFAVGDSLHQALVARWNGTSWSLDPATINTGSLQDVSCLSTTNCIAVGNQASGSALLSVRWNGTTWSQLTAPSPGGDPDGFKGFFGVACTSTTSCFGVGGYRDTQDQLKMLIEQWNGSSWSIVQSSQRGVLREISCASAVSCFGVGDRDQQTLAMRYT